ncbi:hypothetical protein [Actinomadura citrea]|uniref:Catechol 2,3-dioxygenase-like lactoylglutathione lyase family enzyme n=1 Tax=Actinomadura citrea TaxID=46158 RepID=A0A7Y9KG00_9ACTN|nr:hypothetical protein [Actinomadura citrea]NYE14483.1 catechol 2,3-dioxygenase-like lactoylglutathione lyase family enzyme [Actinomadura citrea]
MHGPGLGEAALTRRRVLGFAGAATLAGAAALAGARPAAADGRTYTFDLLFNVPHTDNMQGLAYRRGRFYVGFDVGGGHGVIREYDRDGTTLKESAPLAVGHAAEISVRDRDGLLYVATGGGTNPTKVNVVDWSGEPEVVRTIDFGSLGNSGLVAVDNRRDGLLVHAGPGDQGPFVFAFTDLDGTVRSTFDLGYQGVPQGLEMAGDKVLYYTNDTITVLDRAGTTLEAIDIPLTGESEGLAVAPAGRGTRVFFGYNKPNRVYAMKPVFH